MFRHMTFNRVAALVVCWILALLALVTVSPSVMAQLNIVSPNQIAGCSTGGVLVGGATASCTASPTLAAGSITASAPVAVTQTWNNAGVTFKGMTVTVTDTNSAAGSLLMDLLTGSTSEFSVTKTGIGTFNSSVIVGPNSNLSISGRLAIHASADSLPQFYNNATTEALELNVGIPTLGTCTGGSMTAGAKNSAGQYTGNTSGSCVINFGTPNFTNTPYCFAMSTASTTHPRISASSASSITVTGGVSGETIQFMCIGRIGT